MTISADKKRDLEERIIRFDEMIPCKTAFIDARTPGSDQKENFCLIGEGVSENPDQHTHIKIAHGFNIGAARQPKGCKNSHHSHDTEEVFMVHSGEWEFTWGETGDQGSAILSAGDVITLPTNMFRGFENLGTDNAILFSILGLDENGSAGHVLWAPYVFEQAEKYGLVLLEDGRLLDTTVGQKVPADGVPIRPTTKEQVERTDDYSYEEMAKNIYKHNSSLSPEHGGLNIHEGVTEKAIIGLEGNSEDLEKGQICYPHNFSLRKLHLSPKAEIPLHTRSEEEVIIVQEGSLSLEIDDHQIELSKGDLFSVPISAARKFRNLSSNQTECFIVRRGDYPRPAQYL